MAAPHSAQVPSWEQSKPAGELSRPAPEQGLLRVGIDIRRLGDFGVGTYIKNLIRALARAPLQQDYVLIGSPEQFESLGPLPPNFRLERHSYPYYSHRANLSLPLIRLRQRLDVLHMPHRLVPYFMLGTYVATLHDIDTLLYPDEAASRSAQRIKKHAFGHGLRRAARVIAVSEATKRDAVAHLGLSPQKISVVHNAIDALVAQPVQEAERYEILHRYRIHDPFVLYAGRIRPHKNIPRLIEAFAVVKAELENHERFRNLRLIVIGDELGAFPAVRHAVMRTRVQQSVRFLGFVSIKTLRCFYDAATAFLFPSLYEGFGLPPLEAMAHGTPVVASSVSSLSEAVGDAAVLVNPENVFDIARGLRQVLLDDDLREQMLQKGFEQVQRFSWDRSAEQVLEIYREVALPR